MTHKDCSKVCPFISLLLPNQQHILKSSGYKPSNNIKKPHDDN